MLTIKTFVFNPITENCYILYDSLHEAVIIDPGNYTEDENEALAHFIENENLNVKYILNTHPHVDHVIGNDFCTKRFSAPLLMHQKGLGVYRFAPHYCVAFGLDAPLVNKNCKCFTPQGIRQVVSHFTMRRTMLFLSVTRFLKAVSAERICPPATLNFCLKVSEQNCSAFQIRLLSIQDMARVLQLQMKRLIILILIDSIN